MISTLKQRAALVLLLFGAVLALPGFIPVAQAGSNLIPNPSVETVSSDPNLPQDWQHGGWGNNTATYTYQTSGAQNGSRSLYVKVSNYHDGDVKWYFTPVAVAGNQAYIYSDYYKASVASELVAQVEHADSSITYQYIGDLARSTAWRQAAFSFSTPADAVRLTVFHLIYSNGWLQTDTFSLHTPTDPIITNNVPNNSLEQVSDENANLPLAWNSSGWGTNTATFSYLRTGHTGGHSVKTQITSYTSGDAKWYYDPQSITPGQHYTFTDYYKSDVSTDVVAAIQNTDGSTSYLGLSSAAPSSSWTRYRGGFTAPDTARTVTIFHLIASVGYLTVDDYSLLPSATGFARGLVSFTFDDGWASQYTAALPLLNQYHTHATFYLVSSFLNTEDYMSIAQAKAVKQAGNQIGSHTVTHTDLTTLNDTQVRAELANSKTFLQNTFGGTVRDFASPYGAYNAHTVSLIKQYYRSHRSSDLGFNTIDAFDVYNIKIQSVEVDTTLAQVEAWVTQAAHDKSWLVLLYHQIDTSGSQYSTTPANLATELQAVAAHNLTALTVDQAINEITPQL